METALTPKPAALKFTAVKVDVSALSARHTCKAFVISTHTTSRDLAEMVIRKLSLSTGNMAPVYLLGSTPDGLENIVLDPKQKLLDFYGTNPKKTLMFQLLPSGMERIITGKTQEEYQMTLQDVARKQGIETRKDDVTGHSRSNSISSVTQGGTLPGYHDTRQPHVTKPTIPDGYSGVHRESTLNQSLDNDFMIMYEPHGSNEPHGHHARSRSLELNSGSSLTMDPNKDVLSNTEPRRRHKPPGHLSPPHNGPSTQSGHPFPATHSDHNGTQAPGRDISDHSGTKTPGRDISSTNSHQDALRNIHSLQFHDNSDAIPRSGQVSVTNGHQLDASPRSGQVSGTNGHQLDASPRSGQVSVTNGQHLDGFQILQQTESGQLVRCGSDGLIPKLSGVGQLQQRSKDTDTSDGVMSTCDNIIQIQSRRQPGSINHSNSLSETDQQLSHTRCQSNNLDVKQRSASIKRRRSLPKMNVSSETVEDRRRTVAEKFATKMKSYLKHVQHHKEETESNIEVPTISPPQIKSSLSVDKPKHVTTPFRENTTGANTMDLLPSRASRKQFTATVASLPQTVPLVVSTSESRFCHKDTVRMDYNMNTGSRQGSLDQSDTKGPCQPDVSRDDDTMSVTSQEVAEILSCASPMKPYEELTDEEDEQEPVTPKHQLTRESTPQIESPAQPHGNDSSADSSRPSLAQPHGSDSSTGSSRPSLAEFADQSVNTFLLSKDRQDPEAHVWKASPVQWGVPLYILLTTHSLTTASLALSTSNGHVGVRLCDVTYGQCVRHVTSTDGPMRHLRDFESRSLVAIGGVSLKSIAVISGELFRGDIVVELNGHNVLALKARDVSALLANKNFLHMVLARPAVS